MWVRLCVVMLAGCSDYHLDEVGPAADGPRPSLQISPHRLILGPTDVGYTATSTVTLSNEGDAPLLLQHVGLDIGTAFAAVVPELHELLPGQSLDVAIQHAPQGPEDTDQLRIISDDAARPEAVVALTGIAALPALLFDPNPLVLAARAPGSTATATVMLTNSGSAMLDVSDILVNGDAFFLLSSGVPDTLEPGTSTWAEVSFTPPQAGRFDGQLWTQDNTLSGANSASIIGASAIPLALCDVQPRQIAPIRGQADWIGSRSLDATGQELATYHWALIEQPEGSMATLPAGEADLTGFVPDLAGTYIAELVVETQDGDLSAPCQAHLEAVPDQNLWIEMYWQETNDDMDLHLLRPGGEPHTRSDCYFDNCVGRQLDWGLAGVQTDNPSLDIDDIYGTGPENINIAQPEAGTFSIYVHDYTGSAEDYYGENLVTVKIFLYSELAWQGTRAISGDGKFVPIAAVTIPSGDVQPLP